MKRLFTIVFLGTFLVCYLQAQIQAPDFLCVQGDSLFWDLPTNTCGPFLSYEIYSSTDLMGPYVKIADVTDPSQIAYFDLNPSGEQRWYYLQSNFDCPGEPILQSDTLDNRPPAVSPIQSLVVEADGTVTLEWAESPSPEVFAYIIYRETNLGVVPIDTVFGQTTYLDLEASANLKSERYFVNALDRCGTTSVFDVAHRTILIAAEIVPCEQGFALMWNLYDSWPNGVSGYEIWLSEDGTAPFLGATASGSLDNFIIGGLTDGVEYTMTVQAVEAVTGNRSISNAVTLTADIVQPTTSFFIENVDVLPDNTVNLTWSWNTNAEITQVEVFSAPQNGDYQSLSSFPPQFPLQTQIQFLDENNDPGAGQVFYEVQTVDECGDAATSTYGASIYLNAFGLSENSNQLNWTAFEVENAAVNSIDVYRIQDGSNVFLGSVGAGETTYMDEFSPDDFESPTLCYFVEAQGSTVSADGNILPISSRSNIGCVKQDLRIFVPNAFAPNGFNREFRPVLGFDGDVVEYKMEVYDRYGEQVFRTQEIGEGWRGKKDGRQLPQGVYVYQITVSESNGEVTEKRGKVLLIK